MTERSVIKEIAYRDERESSSESRVRAAVYCRVFRSRATRIEVGNDVAERIAHTIDCMRTLTWVIPQRFVFLYIAGAPLVLESVFLLSDGANSADAKRWAPYALECCKGPFLELGFTDGTSSSVVKKGSGAAASMGSLLPPDGKSFFVLFCWDKRLHQLASALVARALLCQYCLAPEDKKLLATDFTIMSLLEFESIQTESDSDDCD